MVRTNRGSNSISKNIYDNSDNSRCNSNSYEVINSFA